MNFLPTQRFILRRSHCVCPQYALRVRRPLQERRQSEHALRILRVRSKHAARVLRVCIPSTPSTYALRAPLPHTPSTLNARSDFSASTTLEYSGTRRPFGGTHNLARSTQSLDSIDNAWTIFNIQRQSVDIYGPHIRFCLLMLVCEYEGWGSAGMDWGWANKMMRPENCLAF